MSKEMFSFIDRGERNMTLKPEGTAPVVRACVENNLFAQHTLLKLYYIGQNFRYERGQTGRYRQHQQLGIEAFGSSDPALDAEVIQLAMTFYRELGITEQALHINSVGAPASRAVYKEALKEFVRPFLNQMSAEGQQRFELNPLRMLDTKDKSDLSLLENAPRLVDYLDEESALHFEKLQTYLDVAGIAFEIDHKLVRGFDYYTKTCFEVIGQGLGSQSTLCGGGRYDGLVEECGGNPTPGVGFGAGIERCLISLEALGIELPVEDERPFAFIITLGDEALVRPAAIKLMTELRIGGVAADMDYRSKKFGQQAKRADDLGARYTLILGDSELAGGVVQLRDQASKEQREIPIGEVLTTLKGLK